MSRASRPRSAAGDHCLRGGLCIDRVCLAPSTAGCLVRLVDLHHLHALAEQVAGQPGTVRAGAFDPGPGTRPRPRAQPNSPRYPAAVVGKPCTRSPRPAPSPQRRHACPFGYPHRAPPPRRRCRTGRSLSPEACWSRLSDSCSVRAHDGQHRAGRNSQSCDDALFTAPICSHTGQTAIPDGTP